MTRDEQILDLLESALYSTETTSGWYGQPECAEVARILLPTVKMLIDLAVSEASGNSG